MLLSDFPVSVFQNLVLLLVKSERNVPFAETDLK